MTDPILNACLNPLPAPPKGKRAKRSIGESSLFWAPGQTLLISFFGNGPDSLKQTIFELAEQWTQYANLYLAWVDDNDSDAHIRIKIDGPEEVNRSYLGNQATQVEGPSMWVGMKPSHEEFNTAVLHEFGHALGMFHEHQHPDAGIQWNMEYIREVLANNASDEERQAADFEDWLDTAIVTNYLPLERSSGDLMLPYDPTSIMHYRIADKLILGGGEIPLNTELSDKDKAFMQLAYPRD